jgi:hypothetical protein
MATQWIDSKVYGRLVESEGESAYGTLAVYATLLSKRNLGHCYAPLKNSNNKPTKHYRLLSKETGISYGVIKHHTDILISAGLCYFTKTGGLFMLGKDSVAKKESNKHKKRLGIKIGKTFCDTKTNVRAVMIVSSIKDQQTLIKRKTALRKLKKALDNNSPLSSKQLKLRNLLLKAGKEIEVVNMVQITVLSNQGFARVLKMDTEDEKNNISKGNYWKKKLVDSDFIRCRRRYKTLWGKTMSYAEFLCHKRAFTEKYGFVTYKNGRIVKPVVSEIGKVENFSYSYINSYNSSIYNTMYNTKESLCLKVETTSAQ